jgi:hypothetical protein
MNEITNDYDDIETPPFGGRFRIASSIARTDHLSITKGGAVILTGAVELEPVRFKYGSNATVGFKFT